MLPIWTFITVTLFALMFSTGATANSSIAGYGDSVSFLEDNDTFINSVSVDSDLDDALHSASLRPRPLPVSHFSWASISSPRAPIFEGFQPRAPPVQTITF